MDKLDKLQVELLYHKYLYYEVGEPIISDYQFDMMEKRSYQEAKENGFNADKWDDPQEDEKHHVHWMIGFSKESIYWESVVKKYNLVVDMTVNEFNIKYFNYLEEGHYGLDIFNPEVIKALDEMFEKVFTKIPNFKFSQIKTKFGRCCFYSNLGFGHHTSMVENHINTLLSKGD